MARRGYAPEFRRRVVELVEGGRKVAEVAADLGIGEQTIYYVAAALENLRGASQDRFRRPFGGDILRRWLSHSQLFLLARHVLTSGAFPAAADSTGWAVPSDRFEADRDSRKSPSGYRALLHIPAAAAR